MQNPRTLLKNTRASLRFHKRLIIFLVALLVLIVGLVALGTSLSGLTAAGDEADPNSSQTGTSGSFGAGSGTTGQINVYVYTNTPTPGPSSTHTPTPSTTGKPTTTPFEPFTDTPEYGLGGGLIALLACFVAFTLYMRKTKATKKA